MAIALAASACVGSPALKPLVEGPLPGASDDEKRSVDAPSPPNIDEACGKRTQWEEMPAPADGRARLCLLDLSRRIETGEAWGASGFIELQMDSAGEDGVVWLAGNILLVCSGPAKDRFRLDGEAGYQLETGEIGRLDANGSTWSDSGGLVPAETRRALCSQVEQ